jgi:DNA-3-methyladenine glycosylase
LPAAFYRRAADEVARDLLGRYLEREADGAKLVLRIVETEAYLGVEDPASHARGGRRTARNEVLYAAGGVAYVYLVYGVHHCLNTVTGNSGDGSAVLIRAGEPLEGEEVMVSHRRLARSPRPGEVAGGPGKLCQALAIDRGLNGARLDRSALRITSGLPSAPSEVVAGPRIGVDYAGEAATWPLRFAVRQNSHVSRPWPR